MAASASIARYPVGVRRVDVAAGWTAVLALVVCFVACEGAANLEAAKRPCGVDLPPRVPAPRPEPVAGAPTVRGRLVTVAVTSFLLGDIDWAGELRNDAWHDYGFDLDGLQSTTESSDHHCFAGGLAYQADGPEGRDNGFARYFLRVLHNFTESRAVSKQTNDAIADGEHTLLFRIDGIADSGPQANVEVSAFVGGAAGSTPLFNGQDRWQVRESSVDGGDVSRPRTTYRGYVADDVFVATTRTTQPIEITFRGYRLRLPMREATLSLDLRSIRSGGCTTYGVLTGALVATDMREPIQRLAFEMFRTCYEDAVRLVVGTIGIQGDIRSDLSNGNSDLDCDAVSIGIGFVAVEASLGPVVPDEPVRDPCAGDGVVESDGALAGTCDTVPPYELAVTCGPVQRPDAVYPEHRASQPMCSQDRPRGPVCHGQWAGESDYNDSRIDCYCHEDCDDGENGRCYVYGYYCSYDECFGDADCAPEEVCVCRGGADGNHICLPADCRTDTDCLGGLLCRPTLHPECWNLGPPIGFYCETSADECGSHSDCAGPDGQGGCVFDPEVAHWLCTWSTCTTP